MKGFTLYPRDMFGRPVLVDMVVPIDGPEPMNTKVEIKTIAVQGPIWNDTCSACGEKYTYIQAPHKPPGVIMSAICKCPWPSATPLADEGHPRSLYAENHD